MPIFAQLAMSQRWSAIFCATGAWGGKPIGRLRVKWLMGLRIMRKLDPGIKVALTGKEQKNRESLILKLWDNFRSLNFIFKILFNLRLSGNFIIQLHSNTNHCRITCLLLLVAAKRTVSSSLVRIRRELLLGWNCSNKKGFTFNMTWLSKTINFKNLIHP